MINTADIVFQSIVNFNQYAPAIIGNGYDGAKVLAILDADSANQYINTATVHASIYPLLPAGTPDDPTAYPYLKLKLASGSVTAVGLPWIVDSSWVVQDRAKLTIVMDSVDPDDRNRITAALVALGFNDFTVTVGTAG